MPTVWEVLIEHFELVHRETCEEYLGKARPIQKLVEDFAQEFFDTPGLARQEYWQLVEHFENKATLIEKLCYAKVHLESEAVQLMESFALTPELMLREVHFPTEQESSYTPNHPGLTREFEVWRQDDTGNRFLVDRFPTRYEAELECKRLVRRGHKQHYWSQPVE